MGMGFGARGSGTAYGFGLEMVWDLGSFGV